MATFNPEMRYAVDWDNDWFICYDAQPGDPLNIMHTGLSSEAGLVNLHWNYVNKSGIGSGSSTAWSNDPSDYGIRKLSCGTGAGTTNGAYFGRTGSTNDFTVVNGNVYTAVFWIQEVNTAGVNFTFTMENGSGSATFNSSFEWQKVTLTFTASGSTTAFKIVKTSSASLCGFRATGFMIVAGSRIPVGFNVGDASNLYDVLRDLTVMSAQWTFGRKAWMSTMFDEGTVQLDIRNDSRIYMPENSTSPLYGKMLQRLRMTIESRQSYATTWIRLFTGWTDKFTPQLGKTTGQLHTVLRGLQGKFQLDKVKYNKPVSGTQTADAIIRAVLLSGFTSATTPFQVILNTARLNAAYFVNPASIMSLDTGVSEIPTTGEGWGGDGNATRVLDDSMKIERGFLFIDRSGVVRFFNRHHYHDPALTPSTVSINMDTDVFDNNYVYGETFYNVIRATYRPSGTNDGIIWNTKEPIEVDAKESKTIDVKLEFEEGAKVTVESVTAFGAADPNSTFTTVPAAVASKSAITYELNNGRVKLTIHNYSRQSAQYEIILRGAIIESFGGQTVEVSSDVRGGNITFSLDSRQLTEENDARNLADYLLGIVDTAVGEFTDITIKSKNATWYDTILNVGIGSKIRLSETQTGHNQLYYIIGENAQWTPGEGITMQYTLFPLFRIQAPWIIGTSVLGTDTYLGY